MTRKHFQQIAALLRLQKPKFKSDRHHAEFCIQAGYVLAAFNPRFNMSRFLEACHHDTKQPIGPEGIL